MTVIKLIYQTI